MKIRHKQSGATIEGNFVDVGEDFKELRPGGLYSLYYKKQWELVPEWRDVTCECVIRGDTESLYHAGYCIFTSLYGTYRLRKIPVRFSENPDVFHEYAFVVERKQ